MQLDLFLDGRELILVNDIVARLLEGQLAGARAALDRLGGESPSHPDLAAFALLVDSIHAGPPTLPGAGAPGSLIEALAALEPAANRLLGAGAATFLLPWWQALAHTESGLDPSEPSPLLRHWMGSARWHLGEEREAVRLWLALCWLDPASFARLAPMLPSSRVREAWAAFDAETDSLDSGDARAWDVRWFPAWLVLRHRWVAHALRPDEIPDTDAPMKVLRLLPRLLALESRAFGDELVRCRTALRDLSPRFFRAYRHLVMETRGQARGSAER
jgi:hypothetical protein